jgi:outer membrane protein assembly factor BamB
MKRYLITSLAAVLGGVTVTHAAPAFDWPQWRGPDRTDISAETGLLKKWPDGGPKRLWLYNEAGLGYSGFSVVAGKLFVMGTKDGKEELQALDVNTGKRLWSAEIGPMFQNDWGGGPRGTPTVDGDRVYALGAQGNLVCVNAAGGKLLWKTSMADFGGKVPNWGYAESPLVDGNMVLCTPGGPNGALVALDKMTGKVFWQSKEFTEPAHYSSIIAVNHNGARQYIQLTMKNFVGINAMDGKLLWKCDWPNGRTAVVPTPIFHDGHVFITSGYGAGCSLTKIGPGNKTEEVYANKNIVNHHGGVILIGDFLYGYSDGKGWSCMNFKTGEVAWADKTLGKGAIAYADGMIYCLEESSGTVVLAEASPKGWSEQSRFKLDPQTTQRSPRGRIWTHPVICNGRLFLRDQEYIYCHDVKGK